jgi:Toastrack DUF4097
MPRWTVEDPITLGFDQVTALRVRAVAGSVAVLSTGERPGLDIDRIAGPPLEVSHDGGVLTVSYPELTWDGVLGWLQQPGRHSAAITVTVPGDCPVQLGVVTAGAIVSGLTARAVVKSVSGRVTLDGVTGTVVATTVSGDVEAQGVGGRMTFNSVSGDLTLADGALGRLDARTVSGRVTADIGLDRAGRLRVGTVSGAVTIRLPAETCARVALRSAAGRVQSEFGGLAASRQPAGKSLNGQLGGGPDLGQVSVTSMSGEVTLLQRDDPAGMPRQPAPAAGGPR